VIQLLPGDKDIFAPPRACRFYLLRRRVSIVDGLPATHSGWKPLLALAAATYAGVGWRGWTINSGRRTVVAHLIHYGAEGVVSAAALNLPYYSFGLHHLHNVSPWR